RDTRESPSLKIIELLEGRGSRVDYHDPHVPSIPVTREHSGLSGRKSVDLTDELIKQYDAVLIATDHDAVDYGRIGRAAKLVIDTRNTMEDRGLFGANVIKA